MFYIVICPTKRHYEFRSVGPFGRSFVRPSVRLSVPLYVNVLVKVVNDDIEAQSSLNLSPENKSSSKAFMTHGNILVFNIFII